MTTAKDLAKNTILFSASEILARVMSFLIIIGIARYLGDTGLGIYSYAFAFSGMILWFVADFGMNTYLTKEASRNPDQTQKLFSSIFGFKIVFGILSVLILFISALVLSKSMDAAIASAVIGIAAFFDFFGFLIKSVFKAYQTMHYFVSIILIERVIAFLLGGYLLLNGYGLIPFVSVFIASFGFSSLLGLIIINKNLISVKPSFNVKLWKHILVKSLPFYFSDVFLLLYSRISTVILTYMRDYAVVGWYSAAFRIERGLNFVPGIVIAVIFPAMSKFHVESKEKLEALYEKTFFYMIAVALPIAIGTTLLATRLILFLYKDAFIESALALQILIWSDIFLFVNILMGYLLNAIDKQKIFAITTGISVVVSIVLNITLISMFTHGYEGAALATVITEAVSFGLLFYWTSKHGYPLNLFKILWKPVVAGLVMAVFIQYITSYHILVIVPAAAAVYGAVLLFTGAVGKDEMKLIRSVLKKN